MAKNNVYERIVHLANVNQLFDQDKLSPLADAQGRYSARPIVEDIVADMFNHPQVTQFQLTVILPQNKIAPGLQSKTKKAVQRYLTAQVRNAEQETARNHFLGSRSFIPTLLIFLTFNGLGLTFYQSDVLILKNFGDAFIALAWVVLMWSGWIWLLDVWENRVKRRAYEVLKSIELNIESDLQS